VDVELTVNGRRVRERVEPRLLLSDFLRQRLGLTGTHVGCEHGVCVEGLAREGALTRLQEAFRRRHALQCGFCTPGILMAALELLEGDAHPTEAQVLDLLSGHLCRCTGYTPIVEAILDAAREGGA
jgi:2-furoyl-CoA dehydrogenase 2Fe-2S iron sulfur subunit